MGKKTEGTKEKEYKLARRLVQIERELNARREEVRLCFYNNRGKKHGKQIEFHRAVERGRWVFGGNRTGKTECGAVEVIWWCRGIHPYKVIQRSVEGWVVSPTSEVQREVAQKKILSYLPKSWIQNITMKSGSALDPAAGVVDSIEIKSVKGGMSRICFKSCEQGRERFQGASLDFVWFDEEPVREVFEECKMRLMDRLGSFWVTMTPLSGLDWIYESVVAKKTDEEYWSITMTWEDNPFLDRKEIKRLRESLSDEELEVRANGAFSTRRGLVYKEFGAEHVVEPFAVPQGWKKCISLDPGLVNPLSAHWYACAPDGTVYVVAEHYRREWSIEMHAERMLEICREQDWPKTPEGKYLVLMDSAASARSLTGDLSVAQAFARYGFAPMTRVNKSVFAGISRVKEFLRLREGQPLLRVFANCTEMIGEFKSYRYAGEHPEKRSDHAMDELRYFLMWYINPPPAIAEKTAVQRDKERLARKVMRENRGKR